jgi:hypothetical protein
MFPGVGILLRQSLEDFHPHLGKLLLHLSAKINQGHTLNIGYADFPTTVLYEMVEKTPRTI